MHELRQLRHEILADIVRTQIRKLHEAEEIMRRVMAAKGAERERLMEMLKEKLREISSSAKMLEKFKHMIPPGLLASMTQHIRKVIEMAQRLGLPPEELQKLIQEVLEKFEHVTASFPPVKIARKIKGKVPIKLM